MHLCGIFDLVWMVQHGRLLHRVRDLTSKKSRKSCGSERGTPTERQLQRFCTSYRMTALGVGKNSVGLGSRDSEMPGLHVERLTKPDEEAWHFGIAVSGCRAPPVTTPGRVGRLACEFQSTPLLSMAPLDPP